MSLLKTQNLSYEYSGGQKALSGVGFSLNKGDRLALIGSNGAGKSTLLQLLVGILKPTDGEIFLEDKPVDKYMLPMLREKIGFIFQNAEHQLFCNTVYEDVIFGPMNMGLSGSVAAERTQAVLNELGIAHLADRAPYRLSAGEKRLAAIACVLSMNPEVLLMDEPSAELDPRARRELIALLDRLPQSKIIATHDLDLAAKLCPRTIILCGGRLVEYGESEKLLRDDKLLRDFGL